MIPNWHPACKVYGYRIKWRRFQGFFALCFFGSLSLMLSGCGENGSSTGNPATQNPVPNLISISPSSLPAGSHPFTLTVTGSGFISGSEVLWNGSKRITTFVSSTQLTAAIEGTDLLITGTINVSVFNPTPGGGTSNSLVFSVSYVPPLSVMTTRLPDAQLNKAYDYALYASGGIPPYSWSLVWGLLPSGLNLSGSGVISGAPTDIVSDATVNFSIQLSDSAFQPRALVQPFNILLRSGSLGRNDTCHTATAINNGFIRASLSPYGDIDVYSFQGTEGSHVTVEVYAQRLSIYGEADSRDIYLDSFLEILDSECSRLSYNDDIIPGTIQDSLIADFILSHTGTYFIRVSDLRGDGRPDFIYELQLTGAD